MTAEERERETRWFYLCCQRWHRLQGLWQGLEARRGNLLGVELQRLRLVRRALYSVWVDLERSGRLPVGWERYANE